MTKAHRPLVMETDLGRDPDDLFALLFFIGAGVPLRAICVSPGDRDQVAVVRAVLRHFALDVPVLTPASRVSKRSITPFHEDVARTLGVDDAAAGADPDGHEELLPTELVDVFVCGPSLLAHKLNAASITIQGGFVPYALHRPKNVPVLAKFEGQESFATFNLGGTKPAVRDALIDGAAIPHRYIGKNVCHTVVYNRAVHAKHCPSSTSSEALRLHRVFIEHYLETHDEKAFHDPLAAFLSRHPEHGVWAKLKPQRVSGKFTAVPAETNHESLVDLANPIDALWPAYFAAMT